MLRKSLIALGFFVVMIPHLGFPESWDTVFLTLIGCAIILLVFLSRRPARHSHADLPLVPDQDKPTISEESPRALHVEHMEIEERPNMQIERETLVDTARVAESPDTETTIEQKVTVTRRRRKKRSTTDPEALSDRAF